MCCKNIYQHKSDKKLKGWSFIIYKFFNHNNSKFILLLSKCIYPYEYMDAWEKFLSPPWLGWQAALKKTKVKLDLVTDIDVLLMVEKFIRGGISHSIYRYAKANNKYMKDYDKNKKPSNNGMKIIYVVRQCRKSLQ